MSPLAATGTALAAFVADHMLDADGLSRSFLCARTLQPWANADLAAYDLSFFFQNAPDMSACLTYENALMSTGEWLCAQLARHAATGDANALQLAQRSGRVILAVAEQGRHYMPGYLPKPFGGLARARNSHEISPDQYTKALIALHAWRPHATRTDAAALDRFIVDAADFFIARKFRHAYRHRTIVTAETHHHALGLFIPLCVLAGNVTGDPRYQAQLPQFDRAMEQTLHNPELHNFNMVSLLVEGFHLAWTAGYHDARLPQLIDVLWRRALVYVNEQGDGFEKSDPPAKTGQVTRMAALAPLVHVHHPSAQAPAVAVKILQRITDVQQLRHFLPADAARRPNSHQWLGHSICDTSVTSWLLAYWRLRAQGLLP